MKSYSKPEIMFDSFALSEDIASCAVIDKGESAQYDCHVVVPDLGISIFNSGNSNCEYQPAEGLQPCYGVPVADFNAFRS